MRSRLMTALVLPLACLALSALPAAADQLDKASVTPDCKSYTIRVDGSQLKEPDAAVRYTLTLWPSSGSPIVVEDTIPVNPNPDGSFSNSATHAWADYGITPPDSFCFSGSATLTTNGGQTNQNTVYISFAPDCLTCSAVCKGTIGDFIWTDSNCDGIQSFAEAGLNGIKVNLRDGAGAIIATTLTGPGPQLQNGYYQFTRVCLGTYTVEVDASTLPSGARPAPCGAGSDRQIDNNCSPAPVLLPDGGSDQSIDFGYCLGGGKTFTIGPSSMEGHLTIRPGDWISGGFSFKFKKNTHTATQFTVASNVAIAVTCPRGGGAGGTIVVDLGTKTYSIPAGNTSWLPTGDANSVLSWMGSSQAPDLCGGNVMDNARGAVYTATVSQDPPSGSLVDFRFKYRDPNAKGKGNVNCLDTSDPRRAKADVCGASWSATVTDP